MRAVVLPGTAAIFPLALPADGIPILNEPLAQRVRAELTAAGFTVVDGSSPDRVSLVLGPGVFVNAACARALAAAAPGGGRLRIRAPGWARLAGGAEAREVDASVVPAGMRIEDRFSLPVVELDAEEQAFSVAEGPEALNVPAPLLVAAQVSSWADVLWLNLFGMAARVRAIPRARGILLVAGAALRARSLNPWRIAGKLVEVGRGCDVHPSAIVEASVLGTGVRIGPGAVVRGSVLGDGAEVEELALVVGSVVGRSARVQRQAMTKFCVLGARASNGGIIQLSVLGEGASIRGGSYLMDRKLDGGTVSVVSADGKVSASGPLLGGALGPGASLGSGVWLAPGRAVPAGAIVTRSPQDVLVRVPHDLAPGVYAVEGGTAVPVRTGGRGADAPPAGSPPGAGTATKGGR